MPVPAQPKIYHITNVDRLASIIADGFIRCDATMAPRQNAGTTIGMGNIKARRLQLSLGCHPELLVGSCTPFYFCSRSVMLYLIYRRNEELTYKGGQEPIVHLEADFHQAVEWAEQNGRRWAFTLSNAGAYYFEDRSNVQQLADINWEAVQARQWTGQGIKEGKQAKFLMEMSFPWELIERVGIFSNTYVQPVSMAMAGADHRPKIEIKRDWYY